MPQLPLVHAIYVLTLITYLYLISYNQLVCFPQLEHYQCGILYLWITPYMSAANANFYEYVKEEYNKKNRL